MDTAVARLALFILVLLLGIVALLVALLRSKKRVQSGKRRPVWDYFLLWPLIFDQPARRQRVAVGGRFFTNGELVAMVIFVVTLIIGLVFG
jgi:hypothetical protein